MNIYPNYENALKILAQDDYKTFPVSMSVRSHKTSTDIYRILKHESRNVFILESAEDNKTWGRYTFLGYNPTLEITSTDEAPHERIRKIIADNKSPKSQGFRRLQVVL
jgi:anthranilate synthase component I trpE